MPERLVQTTGTARPTIAIIGLGYVGLPLGVAFAEAGNDVIGVEVAEARVRALQAGRSYVEDVSNDRLSAALDRFFPTTRYADIAQADAVLVYVPTPLTPNREPDLAPLETSAHALAGVLQKGQLVILESTTYPGTTRELLARIFETSGLVAGEGFSLAFSPERVDPGRTDYHLGNTPKIVGGLTAPCGDRAQELYGLVCERIVRVSTPEAAEMAKLLENIFRSVNIALVNELAILADRMGLDIWEVVDAAATKPYGFMRFDPGPGMGGHCLPVDPFYLSWRARELDLSTEFIELAGKVNQRMPYHCLERIERTLNDLGRPVRDARVGILGVSYKRGVGDVRESPALKIMSLLGERGADLCYHDSFVPEVPSLGLATSPLDELLDGSDLVVIVTAHPDVDFSEVMLRAPQVLDLRGVTRHLSKSSQAAQSVAA